MSDARAVLAPARRGGGASAERLAAATAPGCGHQVFFKKKHVVTGGAHFAALILKCHYFQLQFRSSERNYAQSMQHAGWTSRLPTARLLKHTISRSACPATHTTHVWPLTRTS